MRLGKKRQSGFHFCCWKEVPLPGGGSLLGQCYPERGLKQERRGNVKEHIPASHSLGPLLSESNVDSSEQGEMSFAQSQLQDQTQNMWFGKR